MRIELMLAGSANVNGATTVSTTLDIDTGDPRWPLRLVDAVVAQASEAARHLADEIAGTSLTAPGARPSSFVPLAAVLPVA